MIRSLCIMWMSVAACEPTSTRTLERIDVRVRGQVIRAELADDPEARERGLMFRRTLDDNAGMLFVFESEDYWGFWMKDTFLALSLAFVNDERRITEIVELEPFALNVHRPHVPVRYALEVNAGWFARHGITAGEPIDFPLAQVR